VLGSRLDQATVTRATLVRVLWLQGYPDQARHLSDLAMRSAIADDHLMSILYVLVEAAIPLAVFAGDLASARRLLGTLLDQAPRAGFRIWFTLGRCFNAVLLALSEDRSAGLPGLVEAVQELEETGFRAHLTMFLGFLARTQADAGLIDDAGRTIGRALEWCDTNGEHWFSAELLRLKADTLPAGAADASSLLGQALDLARRQGARSWELRATMSLAHLLRRQGRGGEARTLLASTYDGFTEGFETVDLREAANLLQALPADYTNLRTV
jgi:predicted ATPase